MATGDHVQRDRSEAIKAMTEGLITVFGDRAILVTSTAGDGDGT